MTYKYNDTHLEFKVSMLKRKRTEEPLPESKGHSQQTVLHIDALMKIITSFLMYKDIRNMKCTNRYMRRAATIKERAILTEIASDLYPYDKKHVGYIVLTEPSQYYEYDNEFEDWIFRQCDLVYVIWNSVRNIVTVLAMLDDSLTRIEYPTPKEGHLFSIEGLENATRRQVLDKKLWVDTIAESLQLHHPIYIGMLNDVFVSPEIEPAQEISPERNMTPVIESQFAEWPHFAHFYLERKAEGEGDKILMDVLFIKEKTIPTYQRRSYIFDGDGKHEKVGLKSREEVMYPFTNAESKYSKSQRKGCWLSYKQKFPAKTDSKVKVSSRKTNCDLFNKRRFAVFMTRTPIFSFKSDPVFD